MVHKGKQSRFGSCINYASLFWILTLLIVIQYGSKVGALRLTKSIKSIGYSNLNKINSNLKSEDERESGEEHFNVFHFEFAHTSGPIIIALWIFLSALARISFHMMPGIRTIFPESCFLIVLGIIIGFIFFLTSNEIVSTFTPKLFFLLLLPLIIFEAGYFMPNRMFFDHLGTVLLMAVIGTIWNTAAIGGSLYLTGLTGCFGDDPPNVLETFLFSSLISAVDPVAVLALFEEIQADEILHMIVFGESLLNDAVTVVLYEMFESYTEIGLENLTTSDVFAGIAEFFVVALGGTLVGIIWGYVTGFVTRFTHGASVIEPLLVFAMAFLSYYTAEMLKWSSILAITFSGITMKNYVERNISANSQATLKQLTKMLASTSETLIFIFLGVTTVQDNHDWNWGFVGCTILYATVFRIIGVLMFTALANRFRLYKLGAVDQFVMMWGGMRGGVAFALVLEIGGKTVPHAGMFVTTTIAMIYWTSFVQGISIKPLVKLLGLKTAEEKNPTMPERINRRIIDHLMGGLESVLGNQSRKNYRNFYNHIDHNYIKQWILRDDKAYDQKILETFEKRIQDDAMKFMRHNAIKFNRFESLATGKAIVHSEEANDKVDHNNNNNAILQVPVPTINMPIEIRVEDFEEAASSRRPSHLRRSITDPADVDINNLLSIHLVEPTNRRRRLSERHWVQDVTSVQDLDVAEPVDHPTFTRHQLKQAAQKLTSGDT